MRRVGLIVFGVLCVGGCASAPRVIVSQDRDAVRLSQWLRGHPLAPDQGIRVDELGRSESASVHIVQIRTREQPHIHQRHDLVAWLQRGRGRLVVGSQQYRLAPGDIVTIPRGTPHHFTNTSAQPAVALVVFSPPFSAEGGSASPAQAFDKLRPGQAHLERLPGRAGPDGTESVPATASLE